MGAIRLESTQIRWFSWFPGGWPKTLKSWKTTLENQGTWSDKRHSDSLTVRIINLLFLRERWKREICCWWWCSESQCITRLSNDDTVLRNWFLRTQYILFSPYSKCGGGGNTDSQHLALSRPSWVSHLPPSWSFMTFTRFPTSAGFLQLFCNLERQKPIFPFPAIH